MFPKKVTLHKCFTIYKMKGRVHIALPKPQLVVVDRVLQPADDGRPADGPHGACRRGRALLSLFTVWVYLFFAQKNTSSSSFIRLNHLNLFRFLVFLRELF